MDTADIELSQIAGTVSAVVYHNAENGYAVLRLDTDENIITAVGCIPSPSVGERVILTGKWTSHPSYGDQFSADIAERMPPTGRKEIFDYLAGGGVRGVGPVLAAAIVQRFGEQSLEIIENEPERLSEIRGISPKKAREIQADFRRRSGLRTLMELFAQNGVAPQMAVALYSHYGEDAMDAVIENPYILTHESIGADFFEADAFALKLGFEPDCNERVEAAVLFELRHNLNNGHAFIPRDKLCAVTEELIGVGLEAVEEALSILLQLEYVVEEDIAGVKACYLAELHHAETYVADRLMKMAVAIPYDPKGIDRLISKIEAAQGITYAGLQRDAVELASKNRLLVLTGGPGTGKTTAVQGILAMFDSLELDTVLAAPTGRAAKRMSELTGREAMTIHRLLGAGYPAGSDRLSFERDENDPIDADAVILDETSMVDILLMEALLSAMKPNARLVLVGDADQLPSVGPGNVFSDIIRSEIAPTVHLTEIFRQAQESDIIKNAHSINNGVLPDLRKNKGDFFFLQRTAKDAAADTIVDLCRERLPNNMGIPADQIQVLSPTRRDDAGTFALNRMLQAALNPPSPEKKEIKFGDFLFRTGDRVMQIRNDYDIIWKKSDGTFGTGMFNGDIGRITEINLSAETVTVEVEDRVAVYSFDMLSQLEPAFAMTVHKSQGSEYRAVILAATRGAPMLMTRGVLYTAVTRAKELIIIVGDGDVVAQMTGNDRRQRRYSGLRARLSQ